MCKYDDIISTHICFLLPDFFIKHYYTPLNKLQPHYQPNINMQNDKGQGVSHAKDSQLPQGAQEKVPSYVDVRLL